MKTIPRDESIFKQVIKLRKLGKSYNQVSKTLGVAKSTISTWLTHEKWSETIKIQLINNSKIKSSNYLRKINTLKHIDALKRHDRFRLEARLEYSKLRKNKLFLTGLAIYWGEGEKTDSGRVSLVNSDANMLRVIVNFYRKILKVPEEKLRAALFIYQDIDEKKALTYWSRLLRINKKNFIKTQILPSKSKLTKRKVVNGMCNIYFSNTKINVKIRERINMLANDMRD